MLLFCTYITAIKFGVIRSKVKVTIWGKRGGGGGDINVYKHILLIFLLCSEKAPGDTGCGDGFLCVGFPVGQCNPDTQQCICGAEYQLGDSDCVPGTFMECEFFFSVSLL